MPNLYFNYRHKQRKARRNNPSKLLWERFSSLNKFTKYIILILFLTAAAFTTKGIYDLKVRATDASNHFYSVNWHPIWFDTGWINTQIGLMKQAGVQGTRMDVNWDMIETSKGVYNNTYLSRIDEAVDKSAANGIDSLLIVLSTPGWANNNKGWKTPPDNLSDYTDFLKFLINRYNGSTHAKVRAFEIWNEPNGSWGWSSPNPPADYTNLLKAAYTAAKAVDPSIIILGGSLSGTDEIATTFLRGMYANGAKGYFDILSQHGYGDPPVHVSLTPEQVLDGIVNNILPIMQTNWDGSKHIWLTEHGYNTSTSGVSEETQASYLTRFYNYAKELQSSRLPNLDNVYYYQWINTGASNVVDCPSSSEGNYGLLTYGLNANCTAPANGQKPAYYAFKEVALGSSPAPTPTPTTAPALTPTPTPGSDNTPPTISITSPATNSFVKRGSTVQIQVSAQDNVGVTKVQFYVNNSLTCTQTTSPFTCSWKVPSPRSKKYTLTAKVYDAAGNNKTSSPVTIYSY